MAAFKTEDFDSIATVAGECDWISAELLAAARDGVVESVHKLIGGWCVEQESLFITVFFKLRCIYCTMFCLIYNFNFMNFHLHIVVTIDQDKHIIMLNTEIEALAVPDPSSIEYEETDNSNPGPALDKFPKLADLDTQVLAKYSGKLQSIIDDCKAKLNH